MTTTQKPKIYSGVFSIIVLILSWLLLHKAYIWMNTETTDNAYVEVDITSVSSEISGIIEEILVLENTPVEKGQVIAKISDTIYKAQYQKALSSLQSSQYGLYAIETKIKLAALEKDKAQDDLEFAQTNYKIASADYVRTKELSKDKFASKQKLDASEIAYEKAKTTLAQAKVNLAISTEKLALLEVEKLTASAALSVAEQEKIMAEYDLDNTLIKAPVDGYVGGSFLRLGNYVHAGTPLFKLVPFNKMYVKANFKETQISKFTPDSIIEIEFDSIPGQSVKGTLRNISPATSAQFSLLPPFNASGNFTKIVQRVPVIIDFDMDDSIKGKIKPGLSAVIKVTKD